MKCTCKGAFEDILRWNAEDEIASAFAIEVLMVDELWETVGIEQFDIVDELQV